MGTNQHGTCIKIITIIQGMLQMLQRLYMLFTTRQQNRIIISQYALYHRQRLQLSRDKFIGIT